MVFLNKLIKKANINLEEYQETINFWAKKNILNWKPVNENKKNDTKTKSIEVKKVSTKNKTSKTKKELEV